MTTAQAGDSLTCQSCSTIVAIPKLGELRQLPRVEEDAPETATSTGGGESFLFLLLSLVAVGCLLVTGYCGIRWAMIEVEATTDSHVAEIKSRYLESDPAVLVREFEDMEKYSLDLIAPFVYQKKANEKWSWALNAGVAGAIALVSGGAGLALASRR
ncbi:MAG: hypothetical protein AAFX06_03740 [Planctomycetota bacterium]